MHDFADRGRAERELIALLIRRSSVRARRGPLTEFLCGRTDFEPLEYETNGRNMVHGRFWPGTREHEEPLPGTGAGVGAGCHVSRGVVPEIGVGGRRAVHVLYISETGPAAGCRVAAHRTFVRTPRADTGCPV